MMAKTHMLSTLAAGTSLLYFPFVTISHEFAIFYLSGLIIGSLFPDIDEPYSAIGRKTVILSTILNKLLGHRGLTHTFVFFMFFMLFSYITYGTFEKSTSYFLIGFSLGILFHQFGDMIAGGPNTKGGIVNYFFPLFNDNKKTYLLPYLLRCKVGDIKEHLYLVFFLMIFVYNLANMFILY